MQAGPRTRPGPSPPCSCCPAVQVRYAFLAGLLVCIALIPVNRLIAGAIQSASRRMMAAKDTRVAAVRELVAHMRLVKMLAWEGLFVRKVGAGTSLQHAMCAVSRARRCLYSHASMPAGQQASTQDGSVMQRFHAATSAQVADPASSSASW